MEENGDRRAGENGGDGQEIMGWKDGIMGIEEQGITGVGGWDAGDGRTE